MMHWRGWRRMIGLGANRRRLDQDLTEEMRFHVEQETADLIRQGLSPEAARRQAQIAFGSAERFQDEARDVMSLGWLHDLRNDAWYALRSLRRTPVFTLVAVSALAIGVGANATVFGAVDAIAFRQLPARAPNELVAVYGEQGDATLLGASYPTYLDLKREVKSFRDLAAFTEQAVSVSGVEGTSVAWAVHGSDNYFTLLGVRAERGRLLEPGDQDQAVVVISHSFWQNALGADPRVIGSTLRVSGASFTVIGVTPPSFHGTRLFTYAPALWLPIGMHGQSLPGSESLLQERGRTRFNLIARLQPGTSVQQATLDANRAAQQLAAAYPRLLADLRFRLYPNDAPINPWLAPRERIQLFAKLLLAGVCLVLLIACADVANLLLARMSARQHEIAIRLSLGASRFRLFRQFLTESLVLALLGGIAAIPLAYVCLIGASQLTPPLDFATSFAPRLDLRVLLFTGAIAFASGLVFGVTPLLHAWSPRPDRGSSRVTGSSGKRLRGALIITQVAVSVVVLFTAGLFWRGLQAARAVDVGFDARQALVFTLDPRLAGGYDARRSEQLYTRLHERLSALPGVRTVARSSSIPLDGNSMTVKTFADGRDAAADFFLVDRHYFGAMGFPVVEGRVFTLGDSVGTERVLINETLASRLWPDGRPVGRKLHLTAVDGREVEVIGIVRSGASRQLGDRPRPLLWHSLERNPIARTTMILRTTQEPLLLSPAVRSALHQEAPDVPLIGLRTLEQQIALAYSAARSGALAALAFALLAALLAIAGIVGVIAYSASQRTREIGIRTALGARSGQVLRLVVGDGIRLALIGAALGVAATFAVPGSMSKILYGVSPRSPILIAVPTLLFLLVATLACLAPAWRAIRIDPIKALRPE
jgi:predicted permease